MRVQRVSEEQTPALPPPQSFKTIASAAGLRCRFEDVVVTAFALPTRGGLLLIGGH